MNLDQLMAWAQDKTRFQGPGDYADFCEAYLDFMQVKAWINALVMNTF